MRTALTLFRTAVMERLSCKPMPGVGIQTMSTSSPSASRFMRLALKNRTARNLFRKTGCRLRENPLEWIAKSCQVNQAREKG